MCCGIVYRSLELISCCLRPQLGGIKIGKVTGVCWWQTSVTFSIDWYPGLGVDLDCIV